MTATATERLGACPSCGASRFARASLHAAVRFERTQAASDHDRRALLTRARELAQDDRPYLVYRDEGEVRLFAINDGSMRVGRGLNAEVRFDDQTVSRRHALVVRDESGVKVLDDRSLNGVFVNGERVDGRVLLDGDELLIGRHRLHFLAAGTPAPGAGAARTDLQATTGLIAP